MKRITKLQIVDLKDERSAFERELTIEEAKKIVGGGDVMFGGGQNPDDPPCRGQGLSLSKSLKL